MKTFLLLALAVAAPAAAEILPAAPAAPAPAASVTPAADPCAGADALENAPACKGRALCGRAERVKVACSLRDAMERRYVFFGVKGRMLAAAGRPAFDSRRHLTSCIAAEHAIAREDDPLRFYDRLRRCTAGFEDGHLMLSVPGGLPVAELGVQLRASEGRLYVASRAQDLERTSGVEDLDRVLAVGAEVVAIDGQPAAEALEAMSRLVPASSIGARREKAVSALTHRDFAFPARATAALTVAAAGRRRAVVELPWRLSAGAASNPLTRDYVRRTGIAVDGAPRAAEVPADGTLRSDSILPPEEQERLRAFRGDRGQLAARLGEVTHPGRPPYCYAQILTFHTETLSDAESTRDFPTVLAEFLRGCEDGHRDLVLDLRENGGGYISHSSALAAMLLPRTGRAPGGALLVRATKQTERVYAERNPVADGAPDSGSELGRILAAITAARRSREDYPPAFLEAPLHADAAGGFSGGVVELVSPSCMSACDRLSGLLRSSGRAILVGGPTEGAGGSQQETASESARWTDPEGVVTVSIPNAAMGVQPVSAAGERATADEFFRALALENRPVQPHVRYATRREDLVGHNRGWLSRAEAALAQAPRAPAPAGAPGAAVPVTAQRTGIAPTAAPAAPVAPATRGPGRRDDGAPPTTARPEQGQAHGAP